MRKLLLNTLEQAYSHNNQWPDALAPASQDGLSFVYSKPGSDIGVATDASSARAVSRAPATIVLHETMSPNTPGVWVGYADGHIEYVDSLAAFSACQRQIQVMQATAPPATSGAAPVTGRVTLKIVDPLDHPVVGAVVGTYGEFEKQESEKASISFYDDKPNLSDEHGEMSLEASRLFAAKFEKQSAAPIMVVDKTRRLVAWLQLRRADFGKNQVVKVCLSPACTVAGRYTSLGLVGTGRSVARTNTILFKPGENRNYTLECQSDHGEFEFPLPPGDYGIEGYGGDCGTTFRYFRIDPGQQKLNLNIDLPVERVVQLINLPAPELQAIKGWMNGGPVTLKELKGKFVLLDFWGYWCGPCVGSMPGLMALHDELEDQGLVIIAVHDDSLDSIDALKPKLEKLRNTPWTGWNGRNLPFLIALDGGGPTRVKFASTYTKGATTAAYGISGWPTTIAIGRDGRVIGVVDSRSEKGRDEIRKLVKAPTASSQ
jgi:thiol-disulfide isomerase/thioredoxin